jgi:hypothetical protein
VEPEEGYFGERVAATYDEHSASMFDPALVEAAVDRLAELDLMAQLAGMRLEARWGGWSGEPFTALSPAHVSVYERP